MTTIAPTRARLEELERLVADDPNRVCHLVTGDGVLCGATAGQFVWISAIDGDPAASPCRCARDRCAACAAEYTMREARNAA